MSENTSEAAPSAARAARRGTGPDLDAMTAQELVAHISEAQAKLREKQEAAKTALREKWKAEAAEAGLSIDAVMPGLASHGATRGKRSETGGSLPVKFRGPNGETWSGRGKLPKWLQTMEAEGRKRDDFKA
jgi:DNA-binding protein H-NS